jgi:hypothetical protein
MHCPNCGTKASAGQKFCRACGFGLDKVEQLIAEQRTTATDLTTEATGKLSNNRLRRLEKWAAIALFTLGGALGGMLLRAIIFNVMIEQGKIFEGAAILLILAIAALISFLAYLHSERKNSASTRSNPQQRLPEASQALDTAKMLPEPNAEIAASVAEHTTAKLEEKTVR